MKKLKIQLKKIILDKEFAQSKLTLLKEGYKE